MSEQVTGIFNFSGGVNQSQRPSRIGENQLAGLVNCTLVNGLRPRPKFHHIDIEVVTEGGVTGANSFYRSYQQIFDTGKFQMFSSYYLDGEEEALVLIAGILYRVNFTTCKASVLNQPNTSIFLNEYQNRFNRTPAGRFFVIFDDPNYPVIVEDDKIRRANPDRVFVSTDQNGNEIQLDSSEIPVTNLGTYNQNRLVVATRYNEFVIGDPVANGFPDAPISFDEVFVASAERVDQFFTVGNRPINEPITFMGNLVIPDASYAVGPLVVSTERSIYAYRTDQAIPTASQLIQGFGRPLELRHGVYGARAGASVGSDLYYLSTENDIRSLNISRQQQTSGVNSSISEEVKEYFKTRNEELMRYAVVEYFDNRLFVTVNPYRTKTKDSCNGDTYDIAFAGLVVLEKATLSGLSGVSPDVWAGLWTGINPMEMGRIGDDFIIVSKDNDSVNRFYKLVEDSKYDKIKNKNRKVRSRLYSRELANEQKQIDKKLVNLQALFDKIDLSDGFNADVYFKPKQAAQFSKIRSFDWKIANDARCTLNRVSGGVKEFNLGGRKRAECDPATKMGLERWRAAQVMLEIEGDWQLDSLEMIYEVLETSGNPSKVQCNKIIEELEKRNCCFLTDWQFYSIKETLKQIEARWQDKHQE